MGQPDRLGVDRDPRSVPDLDLSQSQGILYALYSGKHWLGHGFIVEPWCPGLVYGHVARTFVYYYEDRPGQGH